MPKVRINDSDRNFLNLETFQNYLIDLVFLYNVSLICYNVYSNSLFVLIQNLIFSLICFKYIFMDIDCPPLSLLITLYKLFISQYFICSFFFLKKIFSSISVLVPLCTYCTLDLFDSTIRIICE